MTIDIQGFKAYETFEDALVVARRRSGIMRDNFAVLRRLSDDKYIVASRVHEGTIISLWVIWE